MGRNDRPPRVDVEGYDGCEKLESKHDPFGLFLVTWLTVMTSRTVGRILFAVTGVALCAVAFLRGNDLLGPESGILYVVVALSLLWLFAHSVTPAGKLSLARLAGAILIALPIGFIMADPARSNSDMQVFIDKQANDRTARSE